MILAATFASLSHVYERPGPGTRACGFACQEDCAIEPPRFYGLAWMIQVALSDDHAVRRTVSFSPELTVVIPNNSSKLCLIVSGSNSYCGPRRRFGMLFGQFTGLKTCKHRNGMTKRLRGPPS